MKATATHQQQHSHAHGGHAGDKKPKTTGPVHNPKYKLKLCEKFERDGTCPYFEKCQFAHGRAELDKWTNRRKQAIAKAQNQTLSPTQRTPQQQQNSNVKSSKIDRRESETSADSTIVLSPFSAPTEVPSGSVRNSAYSPQSSASLLSPHQSENAWFTRTNPLTHKSSSFRSMPPKLSIDSAMLPSPATGSVKLRSMSSNNRFDEPTASFAEHEQHQQDREQQPLSVRTDEDLMLESIERIMDDDEEIASLLDLPHSSNHHQMPSSRLFQDGVLTLSDYDQGYIQQEHPSGVGSIADDSYGSNHNTYYGSLHAAQCDDGLEWSQSMTSAHYSGTHAGGVRMVMSAGNASRFRFGDDRTAHQSAQDASGAMIGTPYSANGDTQIHQSWQQHNNF